MFFIDLFADESEREQSIYILSTAQHPAASHKEIVEGIAKTFQLSVGKVRYLPDKCRIEFCVTGCVNISSIDAVISDLTSKLLSKGVHVIEALPHSCPLPFECHPKDIVWQNDASTLKVISDTFASNGFAVLRRFTEYETTFDSVAMTVTDHIASMIALISGVKSNHSTVRIKFKEVMQRDTGRYDISLQNVVGLQDFIHYASPMDEDKSLSTMQDDGGAQTSSHAPWLAVIECIFGTAEYELCRIGVVVSTGGNTTKAQQWHADGEEDLSIGQAVCFFIPLCDLNETTGYTTLWPGSHLSKQSQLLENDLPSKMPAEFLFKGSINKGDGLIYDYKTIHRGEANHMNRGEIRPIMYLVYARKDFAECNFTDSSIYDHVNYKE